MCVRRYALRPGPSLVDIEDKNEQRLTQYILQAGVATLMRCWVAAVLTRPVAAGRAVVLAIKIGWRSDRGLLRHFGYLLEAALLAQWCRRDGIEHLHAHFGTNAAAISMLAWRLSDIPYSFTAHGPDEFERATLLSLDIKLEHAAFVACVSAFGRSQYMRWCPARLWHKIVIVHCGLDSCFFEDHTGPAPAAPRLVCVGRLCEQKAQLVLVAAARKLHESGVRFQIVLAGDGPIRRQIEQTIQQYDLQNKVCITGWLSGEQIRREVAAARALVLPSFAENMPVVIMEAFALGRAVISTYIAGIPELVQSGKSGWLVQAGDADALAVAMREALEAPQEQLDAMGATGRAHILSQHDAAKEALKLHRLFSSKKAPAAA